MVLPARDGDGPPSKRWLPDQSSARGDGFHNLQEAKAIEINCWMDVRGEGEGESHDKQRFLSHQFAFLFPETGNVGKGADLCQKRMSPILDIL